MRRTANMVVGLMAILLGFGSESPAQDTAFGIPNFSTQIGGPFDSLDLASSNVFIQIPIRSKSAGAVPMSVNLVSNSHIVRAFPTAWGFVGQLASSLQPQAVAATLGYQVAILSRKSFGTCHGLPDTLTTLAVTDQRGTLHPLGASGDSGGCIVPPPVPVTLDDSGIQVLWSTQQIYDKFGNVATTQSNTPSSGWITYTMATPSGVTATATVNTNVAPQAWAWTDTLGSSSPYAFLTGTFGGGANGGSDSYSYYDSSNTQQTYSVSYGEFTALTGFGCTSVSDAGATKYYLPITLSIPGGGSYSFSYEVPFGHSGSGTYGPYTTTRIAKITYPSGGSVSYAYSGTNGNGGHGGIDCISGVVPSLSRTVNDNNGNVGAWTYANSKSSTASNYTVTAQDAGSPRNTIVYNFNGEFQTQAIYYQGSGGTPLKTVTTCYNNVALSGCAAYVGIYAFPIAQTNTYTSLSDPILPSTGLNDVETTYDTFGNVTSVLAYDFGATTLTSQRLLTYGSWNGTSCVSLTGYLVGVPCDVKLENSSGSAGLLTETRNTYDSFGRPTAISKWVSGTNWLTANATYNANGTLATSTDPAGNQTIVAYNGTGGCDNLLPTKVSYAVAAVGSSSLQWDCNGGVPTKSIDVNGNQTTYSYSDSLYRQTKVLRPDGGSTTTTYNTSSGSPFPNGWSVHTTTSIDSSRSMTRASLMDGLARPVQTQNQSDPNGIAYVNTVYNTLGQVYSVSNPFYTAADATYGVTSFSYDALGRKTLITNPDTTIRKVKYTNRAFSTTDESGIESFYQINGLGQLTIACTGFGSGVQANGAKTVACPVDTDTGAGGFVASYVYDAANRLTSLNYSGQVRSWTYDGVGRKLTSIQPEISGINCRGGTYSACYSYDTGSAGDLYQIVVPKANSTASAAFTIAYKWDGMHRLTEIVPGSQTAYHYNYDRTPYSGHIIANPKGHVVEADHGVLAAQRISSYDSMGNMLNRWECTATNCGTSTYNTSYSYNYLGEPTSYTNPAGFVWTPTFNAIGQLTGIATTDTGTGLPATILTAHSYNAPGEPTSVTYGDGITRTKGYDNRMRLTSISDSGSTYSELLTYFGNSSIKTDQDSVNGNWAFTYDPLNRLVSSTQTGGAGNVFTYTYDQFGNRWTQTLAAGSGSGNSFSYVFNSANQITGSSGTTYDIAGNELSDGLGNDYTYDGFGHKLTGSNVTYTYDGSNRVVQHIATGGPTVDLINTPFGNSEFTNSSWSRELVGNTTYFNSVTYYSHRDHLGTKRVLTDYTGANRGQCTNSPFGDSWSCTSSVDDSGFAGGRNWDNSVDHFGARDFHNTHGRFMVPDPKGIGSLVDPANFNLYSYASNDPMTMVDPSGLADFPEDRPASDEAGGEDTDVVPPDLNSIFTPVVFPPDPDSADVVINDIVQSLTADVGADMPECTCVGAIVDEPSTGVQAHVDDSFQPGSFGYGMVQGSAGLWASANGTMKGVTAIYGAGFGVAAAAPAVLPALSNGISYGVGFYQGALGGGSVVLLGKYFTASDNYMVDAEEIGANYFNLGKFWHLAEYFGDAWVADQGFIDASIVRGQTFLLNQPPFGEFSFGTYGREVQYLFDQGIPNNQILVTW
jgi:RHS repeat-associated protein